MDSFSVVTCSDRRLVSACCECHQALHGLELVLHDLELVDRFLLGRFQPLGLLDELLGRLCRAGLKLPRRHHPVGLRSCTGIGAPDRDRGHAGDEEQEGCGGQRDRLGAEAKEGVGRCVLCEIDHR